MNRRMPVTVILFLMGGMFFTIGMVMTILFASTSGIFRESGIGVFVLIPLLFALIGAIMLVIAFRQMIRKMEVRSKGTRYPAKVYGYVDDSSFVVNGQYTVNTKVRFFDVNHYVREAIIPTQFSRNSNMYGIGMTIDIFEYNGRFSWDPRSLRYEHITGEKELMDNRPVVPEEMKLVGVTCPSCGANFQASSGYANRCPYCDGYINV